MSSKSNNNGKGDVDKRQSSLDGFTRANRRKAEEDQAGNTKSHQPGVTEAFRRISGRPGLHRHREKGNSRFEDEDLSQQEEDEMKRVIEMSKQQAIEDQKRREKWQTAEQEHGTTPDEQLPKGSSTSTNSNTELCEADQSVTNKIETNDDDDDDDTLFGSPSLFPSQECHNGQDGLGSPIISCEQTSVVENHVQSSKTRPPQNTLKKKLSLRKSKSVPQEDPNFLLDVKSSREERSPSKRKATNSDREKVYKIPKLSERRSLRTRNVGDLTETEKPENNDDSSGVMNLDNATVGKDGDFCNKFDDEVLLLKRFKEEDIKRRWTVAEAQRAALFFAPPGVHAVQYAQVIEAMFEKYRIDLYLAQSRALHLTPCSNGVASGRTIDGSLNAWRSGERVVQSTRPQLVVTVEKPTTPCTSSNLDSIGEKDAVGRLGSQPSAREGATCPVSVEDSDEEGPVAQETNSSKTESNQTTFGRLKDAGMRLWRSFGALDVAKDASSEEKENLTQNEKETSPHASGASSVDDASQVVSRSKKPKLKILESSSDEEEEVTFSLIIPEIASPQDDQEQLSQPVVGHNSIPQSQDSEISSTISSPSNAVPLKDPTLHSTSMQEDMTISESPKRKKRLRRTARKSSHRGELVMDGHSQKSQNITANGHHTSDDLVDLTSVEDNDELIETSSSQTSSFQCPMCFKSFPADVVAEHAAGCDGPPTTRSRRSNGGVASGGHRQPRTDKDLSQSNYTSFSSFFPGHEDIEKQHNSHRTGQGSTSDDVKCPICQKDFPKSIVANHCAECFPVPEEH